MTTEEKFNAAVNVIRSLPKNGSYQPSNELLLRFYAYYKQATLGPCKGSRPAFWDLVGRAKYDAWKILGSMTKADAMAKYVEELHSIVETMSYSDKVANFLEAPVSELESINMNDLELIVGDVLERVRSQPNSPLASRSGSPVRMHSRENSISPTGSMCNEIDESDDEYIDTIEAPESRKISNDNLYFEPTVNGILQKEHITRSRNKHQVVDVTHEISRTIQSLKMDIENLSKKVKSLEKDSNTVVMTRNEGFLSGIPPSFITFIIVWPFLCTFVMSRFLKNKQF